jgi:hypothetical protein
MRCGLGPDNTLWKSPNITPRKLAALSQADAVWQTCNVAGFLSSLRRVTLSAIAADETMAKGRHF